MVRWALFAGLMMLTVPAAAQESKADLPPAPAPAPAPGPEPAPGNRKIGTDFLSVPVPRHPQRARAQTVKGVDILQSAKDAGHNGRATYTATVGADGKLIALTLKESSMSPAIDEAVRARAEGLYYFPATDKDGNKVEAMVDVAFGYARHDADSPGGGIEDYTCGDLVREWDWFTAANAQRRKLFWPHNAYTSLTTIETMRKGQTPDPKARLALRQQREEMWVKLIDRCRKTPERLMLKEVDQPDAYANLVNSF
jgi:TonB family protein